MWQIQWSRTLSCLQIKSVCWSGSFEAEVSQLPWTRVYSKCSYYVLLNVLWSPNIWNKSAASHLWLWDTSCQRLILLQRSESWKPCRVLWDILFPQPNRLITDKHPPLFYIIHHHQHVSECRRSVDGKKKDSCHGRERVTKAHISKLLESELSVITLCKIYL